MPWLSLLYQTEHAQSERPHYTASRCCVGVHEDDHRIRAFNAGRCENRAAVEAKPAQPQNKIAQRGQGQVRPGIALPPFGCTPIRAPSECRQGCHTGRMNDAGTRSH